MKFWSFWNILIFKFNNIFSKLQSGMIYHYAVVMLIGLTVLITIGSLWDFLEILIDNRLYFIYIFSFYFIIIQLLVMCNYYKCTFCLWVYFYKPINKKKYLILCHFYLLF